MTSTETPEFPTERINELLNQVELSSGHHEDGVKACAMDLIGMAIEGVWTDTVSCVHPILNRLVHRINDHRTATPESRRRLVAECGPKLIGTSEHPAIWAVYVLSLAGLTPGGLSDALDAVDTGANLYRADLTGAKLTRANLTGAKLTRAKLTRANLYRANLNGAKLTRADLYGANLTGANLNGADLTGAKLTRANLTGADLTGAKLTRANLYRADLTGVTHNEATRWPEHFDALEIKK